jgi:hypothetical protein
MGASGDTGLMGPTRRRWLQEAQALWAGWHDAAPDDKKYLWIARCLAAPSLLQRRDDGVADLPTVCKDYLCRYQDLPELLGEQGGHARAVPQVAEVTAAKTEQGLTP